MDSSFTADLNQPIPFFGVYNRLPKRYFWYRISLQVGFCLVISFFLSYFLYKRLNFSGRKSWTKAFHMTSPIRKRLENLEKERAIWEYYLHWMEDYFFLYCDLLKFLNKTTLEVQKVYRDHMLGLRQIASTGLLTEGGGKLSKMWQVQSESSLDTVTSDEDAHLIASFARILARITSDDLEKPASGPGKSIFDSENLLPLKETLREETNEESPENELEWIAVTPEDDFNVMKLEDTEFSPNQNNVTQGETVLPLSECTQGACEVKTT